MAQKKPFAIEEKIGGRAWCAYGLSQIQPFRGGSHKTTEFKPIVVEIEEAGKVAWCGCKRSGNAPFRDGSHRGL